AYHIYSYGSELLYYFSVYENLSMNSFFFCPGFPLTPFLCRGGFPKASAKVETFSLHSKYSGKKF
ncbi:MAG: hypothetical protein IJZ01_01880, partial [Paraprevotella sp.]|nr:hypothetical protein [Paraprevotella sp.]